MAPIHGPHHHLLQIASFFTLDPSDGTIAFGTVPLNPKDATFRIISIRLDDANSWFSAITLPPDISLFEMSITWFAQADLAPFFAAEKRVFRVV